MLEFLQDYNKFQIYERARNAELTLRAFDPVTPMANFVEAVMKAVYQEYYFKSSKDLNVKLNEMFSDRDFIAYFKRAYYLTDADIDSLNTDIRKVSNNKKHDVAPVHLTPESVRTGFRTIYALASGYYKRHSGKDAPAWTDAEYEKLYSEALDAEARKKLEEESEAKIGQLKEQIALLKEEKTSANREIEQLGKELSEAKQKEVNPQELAALHDQIAALEKQIDEADGQSALLKEDLRTATLEKVKAEEELNRLELFYQSEQEEQSQEAKAKISELSQALELAQQREEKLKARNSGLQKDVQQLLVEKNRMSRKLADLETLTEDTAAVATIERQLMEAEARKQEILEELAEQQAKLEEVEERFKAKASELEKLNEKYRERDLKKQYAKNLLRQNTPTCPKCGTMLKYSPSKYGKGYFWRCPNWRQDGSGCNARTFSATEEQNILIRNYLDILDENKRRGPVGLPPEELAEFTTKETTFIPYPESFGAVDPPTYLFQTIAVPEEMFAARRENTVEQYSKFLVSTNLKHTSVPLENRTVYSLALRLLNRGVVLQESRATGLELREKFNKNDLGAVSHLFDCMRYSAPFYAYDSPREKEFAEYYFPQLLGESWASYVIGQAGFDLLVPAIAEEFKDQKADFYINKNGRRIIVELDGPEHDPKKDKERDDALRAAGYVVRRYKNAEVDRKSGAILNDLAKYIGAEESKRIDTDLDTRYMVATKMCHQFAVAIVKCLEQGYFPPVTNLKAEAGTSLFTPSEVQYILHVAAAEVYSILKNYFALYDCETAMDFFDESLPEVWLSIGDGRLATGQGVLIRDIVHHENIQCEIEDFPGSVSVKHVDKQALEFFLEYLFHFTDGFKPGQFDAIERLLEKKDTIVLLPTGSGKSLIYQLSGFIVPGVIVVVAPLVSLIEDQVTNLERKHGITSAIYFASSVTQNDKLQREKSRRLMQHNATTLVYLAPERLLIPSFREDAERLLRHNNVCAVAVDEAHCVSEWGHDFRPAYLNVGNAARRIFSKKGEAPVISALTGTASDAVLNDVRLDLNIRGPEALIQPDTFDRKELHFFVRTCDAKAKAYTIANLIRNELPAAFKARPEQFSKLQGEDTFAGIVFTPLAKRPGSQYSAYEISGQLGQMLPEYGVSEYFSTPPQDFDEATWKALIRENARQFKDDELNVLVATKAFGMGIDKPNIRFIIHDGLPMSFEQYYQEAGRAGRGLKEGERAECVLLFSNDNAEDNERLLNPEIDLAVFKKDYEQYNEEIYQNGSSDDVSSLLYFHNGSFKGVDQETETADRILDLLDDEGFENNKTVSLLMPLEAVVEDQYGNKKTVYLSKDVEQNKWLQALVRLLILGIIKDYTYDYGQTFTVTCGSMGKKSMAEKYACYVSGVITDTNRLDLEKKKILNDKGTGVALAKKAVGVLVQYIYDHIERSRRRAISEMFHTVKEAATKEGEAQNEYLKKQITSYFEYKGENRNALRAVEKGQHAGLLEAIQLFEIAPDKLEYNEVEKMRGREVYVLAGRLLESNPDHPGLLLAQALGRIVSGELDNNVVPGNIRAAIRFSKERYGVADQPMKKAFFTTLNMVLNQSPEMFDELADYYAARTGQNEKGLLADMIQSDLVSDSNRDYLLVSYANLVVNNFMGRFRES